MKNKKELSILILSALVLYPIIVWVGNELSKSEISELSEAVFHVSWYDVSEDALDGLKGVELVNSDYDHQSSMERHIVLYDPAFVSIEEMEKALKEAGTYLGTVK